MSKMLIILEIIGFVQVPLMWWIFRRYFKRNVLGEIIASGIIGVFWEIATEPLWDYNFKITFYHDTPAAVITGWMVMLTLIPIVSEKLYCLILKKQALAGKDKRIFLFDIFTAMFIALPMEAIGAHFGVWKYNTDILGWNWGVIPFFNLPVELIMGYSLLMLIAPTFVRCWQEEFEK